MLASCCDILRRSATSPAFDLLVRLFEGQDVKLFEDNLPGGEEICHLLHCQGIRLQATAVWLPRKAMQKLY